MSRQARWLAPLLPVLIRHQVDATAAPGSADRERRRLPHGIVSRPARGQRLYGVQMVMIIKSDSDEHADVRRRMDFRP